MPWAIHSTYLITMKGEKARDIPYFLILPFLLVRMLHNQIWISLSRYRTAKGANRIVDKGLEFQQVDREASWDDQILLNGILFYVGQRMIHQASNLPIWRTDGVIITALLHAGPVEFLYYWLHRALHHHFLYSRYHSHHHSSIVTEPITSVIHPFAEHVAYFSLFAIPMLTTLLTTTASVASLAGYVSYIDFMNNMGHCNFELVPKSLFSIFPPLKYLVYTPSFHSLHHTQFRTNYSLFMPIYDYIYGTTDKSSDKLYKLSLKRSEDCVDVVHLTHLTTLDSLYHLRLGFASWASRPHSSSFTSIFFSILTYFFSFIFSLPRPAFLLEAHSFKNLNLHSWVIPAFYFQYFVKSRKDGINRFIEEAVLEAEKKGAKVLSLGLLNQGEELNRYGEIYIEKYPKLKVKVVDGSSLAIAVVLNTIPPGTKQVLLAAKFSKVAIAVVSALCDRGIQVAMRLRNNYLELKHMVPEISNNYLVQSPADEYKVWLVGDELSVEDQKKASKGTTFIPLSPFPPKKIRKDCYYHSTPAMILPETFHNVHSCENWLPRRAMSAWRIAGILHALEGWQVDECGDQVFNVDKIWEASLRHGFLPLN